MITYSIITINLNNKVGLEKTILSVISQTYKNIEYIIIDGGSTDGSIDVIKKYESHITYWVSEKDNGIYNAMNKGIKRANGTYLNFLNSSDCFHDNNVLEDISEIISADIVIGRFQRTDSPVSWGFLHKDVTLLDLYKGTFNHQATFFKKELFNNSLYDESLKIVSDWKFFLENLIFKNCSFQNISNIIVDYDITGIAYNHPELSAEERKKVLASLLPQRIAEDYSLFSQVDYNVMRLIIRLSRNSLFRLIINKMVKYKLIKP